MMDAKYENQVWTFYNKIRGAVYFYGSAKKIVQLLFLKSIVRDTPNYHIDRMDDLKALFQLQLGLNSGELTEEDIGNALEAIEHVWFKHPVGLKKAAPLYRFLVEASEEDKKAILSAVREFDLPDSPAERKDVIDLIYASSANDAGKFRESHTPQTLVQLGNGLLEVQTEDSYLDPFAGLSSAFLSLDQYKKYEGFEIDPETAMTSLMEIVMLKKDHAVVYNADFFNLWEEDAFEKIFCDGPLKTKLDERNQYECADFYGTRDVDVLSLRMVERLLKKGGRAVITLTNHFLFSVNKTYETARRTISFNGLKALVYLPESILPWTTVPVTLALVEKDYTGPVAIVDARKIGIQERKNISLQQDDINTICQSVSQMKPLADFVHVVDRSVFFQPNTAEIAWTPARLLAREEKKKYREIVEIEADIEETLKSLTNLTM